MPGRDVPLVNGEIYHLFNRGNEKHDIFIQPRDYRRFKRTLYYYQFQGPKPKFSNFGLFNLQFFNPTPENRLVKVFCYCLMPNHFHLLVQQLKDNGISTFLSQISNSHTKYINTKYNRVGSLLQGTFKSVLVENDEQFTHISRYIHINPKVAGLVERLDQYPWSSYEEYMHSKGSICSTEEILNYFGSAEKYKQFLDDQIEYGEMLEVIKHQLVDNEDY